MKFSTISIFSLSLLFLSILSHVYFLSRSPIQVIFPSIFCCCCRTHMGHWNILYSLATALIDFKVFFFIQKNSHFFEYSHFMLCDKKNLHSRLIHIEVYRWFLFKVLFLQFTHIYTQREWWADVKVYIV